ncbi:uncharacterized protein LOC135492980 [Lineus longissimus]|uniref:uncharacterized protein LOC135492980 n=1 Tax=Lineus longissimus TaxID=88925 RepID=UPI00315D220D
MVGDRVLAASFPINAPNVEARTGQFSASARIAATVNQPLVLPNHPPHQPLTLVQNPLSPYLTPLDATTTYPMQSRLPTPIKPQVLAKYLEGYDHELTTFLLDGFTDGFRLEYQGVRASSFCPNSPSASKHPEVIDKKIASELQEGRILGPFDSPPTPDFRASPIGVVPKKEPGDFRMIHNLSYPRQGDSINKGIPKDLTSVKYSSIYDAISFIKKQDKQVYLAKCDVKSAFRIIPVAPEDYPLLGFEWRGKYYMDRVLLMGASISCSHFERFSTAIEWICLNKLGFSSVVHVLDDFLFISLSKDASKRDLEKFEAFCKEEGIPLAPEKTF